VTVLTARRLYLAPLPHVLIGKSIEADTFRFDVDEVGTVSFGPRWPGDELGMFPGLLAKSPDPVPNSYVAIERATLTAVGQLGATGEVNADGEIEIGYGFGVSPHHERIPADRYDI
jgi:hypothetical protein